MLGLVGVDRKRRRHLLPVLRLAHELERVRDILAAAVQIQAPARVVAQGVDIPAPIVVVAVPAKLNERMSSSDEEEPTCLLWL